MDIPRRRTLFFLKEHGKSSISERSIHAIAKLSAITKIVYRMKADGLVETNTSDGRVTQASLTDIGRHAIEEIQHDTRDIFRTSFKSLTEAQTIKLNGTLKKYSMTCRKTDPQRAPMEPTTMIRMSTPSATTATARSPTL